VIKEQIEPVVLTRNFKRILPSEKREARPQFQKELLDVRNEAGFDFALIRVLGQRKEIEVVGIFQKLLGEVGLARPDWAGPLK